MEVVALEATGVYWIPLFEVLDCQWFQQVMSYGLLRRAFRPADEVSGPMNRRLPAACTAIGATK